jgi:hypothetical protein
MDETIEILLFLHLSNTKIGTQDDGGADTDSYVDNYLLKDIFTLILVQV